MICLRCGKQMFLERFYGRQESFPGWYCLYCGEVIDDTILKNRKENEMKTVIKTGAFIEIKGCYVMKRNYKEKVSDLLGFLPERRKDPTRERGRKSLLKLAHKTFNRMIDDIHSIWLIDVFK